ncbi:hypothetical protein evm_009162 [Chilo suppressalis]|nr:hypothetical protein evm_009162 [Chilo suppressalis]
MNEELIKDRLVCGVTSANIRERLLREEDLTLKKALEICRAAVVSRIYSEDIKKEVKPVFQLYNERQENEGQIDAIRRHDAINGRGRRDFRGLSSSSSLWRGGRGRGPWRGAHSHATSYSRGGGFDSGGSRQYGASRCNSCGGAHLKNECPAVGRQCMRCSRMNHFAKMCKVYCVENTYEQVEMPAQN